MPPLHYTVFLFQLKFVLLPLKAVAVVLIVAAAATPDNAAEPLLESVVVKDVGVFVVVFSSLFPPPDPGSQLKSKCVESTSGGTDMTGEGGKHGSKLFEARNSTSSHAPSGFLMIFGTI
jgi:hypothetical protein